MNWWMVSYLPCLIKSTIMYQLTLFYISCGTMDLKQSASVSNITFSIHQPFKSLPLHVKHDTNLIVIIHLQQHLWELQKRLPVKDEIVHHKRHFKKEVCCDFIGAILFGITHRTSNFIFVWLREPQQLMGPLLISVLLQICKLSRLDAKRHSCQQPANPQVLRQQLLQPCPTSKVAIWFL